jgi:hypothetical protein
LYHELRFQTIEFNCSKSSLNCINMQYKI